MDKVDPYNLSNQTSLSSLRREIANNTTDPNVFPLGLGTGTGDRIFERTGIVTPEMYDPMLATPRYNLEADYPGGGGAYYGFNSYAFYQDIAADLKVSAANMQRVATTIEREWVCEPGGTDAVDIKAADFLREVLMDGLRFSAPEDPTGPMTLDELSDFDHLQISLLDAILMGFSAMEILWEKQGKMIFPHEIKYKPQHRFNIYLGENGWEPRLLTRSEPTFGLPLPKRKFIYHRHRPRFGPFGRGLNYELGMALADKRDTLKFNMVHAQRYVGPTVFLTVPANASDLVIERARETAENIGQEAGNTIPEGAKPFVVEGKPGATKIYSDLLAYFDSAIAQLILGQTGTISQDGVGGSRARDEVADLQTLRKSKQDSRLSCLRLQRTLFRWVTEENFPGAKVPSVRRLYPELEENEDDKAKAERDKIIVDMSGAQLSQSYLENRHRIKFATDDDPAPVQSQPLNLSESDPGESDSEKKSQNGIYLAENELRKSPVENGWSDICLKQTRGALTEYKRAIENSLQAAQDETELRTIFLTMLSDEYLRDQFSAPLAKAMHVAKGIGMIDVEEEVYDETIDLAQGFDPVMGFDAAIAALNNKVPVPTSRWDELGEESQDWAFTVAGVMQADVLTSIMGAVDTALKGGSTFDEFKTQFDDIYKKSGLDPLAPWRVQLVHNQNISNSYQAGRYERSEQEDFKRIAPFRVYRHGGADDPRPHHIALDGFIARADDPVWDSIYPPNGFNCGCRVFHRTQGQMNRQGLSLSDPLPTDGNGKYTITVGNKTYAATDKGFSAAPNGVASKSEALKIAANRLPSDILKASGIDKEAERKAKAKEAERKAKAKEAEREARAKKPDNYQDFIRLAKDRHQKFYQEIEKIKKDSPITEELLKEKNEAIQRAKKELIANISNKEKQRELSKKFVDAERELLELKRQDRSALLVPFDNLRKRLIKKRSKKEAKSWVENNVNIADSVKYVRTKSSVKADLEEFYRISGNKIRGQLDIRHDRSRAYALQKTKNSNAVVNVGTKTGDAAKASLFHECGHHVEFSDDRFFNSLDEWMQSRSPLSNASISRNGEKLLENNFYDEYVGRIYETDNGERIKATEALSMGIQQFITPERMKFLYDNDPEHFDLILGIIESD